MSFKGSGENYKEEVRNMFVELHRSGKSVKSLSNEYGVPRITIFNWIKKLRSVRLSSELIYTFDLQLQILKLQQENTILKKTIETFARK